MHLVRLTLTGPRAPTRTQAQAQAELVHDALWAHRPAGSGIEHVTATATPLGIDLVLFVRHDVTDPARNAGDALDAAAAASPFLARWQRTPNP